MSTLNELINIHGKSNTMICGLKNYQSCVWNVHPLLFTLSQIAFMNDTHKFHDILHGPVDSVYKRMFNRNHCNHRDYQNIAVNGTLPPFRIDPNPNTIICCMKKTCTIFLILDLKHGQNIIGFGHLLYVCSKTIYAAHLDGFW